MKGWVMASGCIAIVLWSAVASGQQSAADTAAAAKRAASQRAETLDRARAEVASSEDQLAMVRKELEELQNRIRQESGLTEATPEGLRQLAERLQQQQEAMEVEEAGAHGRQGALEATIAKYSEQMKKRAASDEVSTELAKVLDARMSQLKRLELLRNQGNVSQAAVDDAQASVAAAQAAGATSPQAASGAAGGALGVWGRGVGRLSSGSR